MSAHHKKANRWTLVDQSFLSLFITFSLIEPTRTLYEQSKSAINRRFCYNMERDSVKLIVKAHE